MTANPFESFAAQIVARAPDAILVADQAGRIQVWNRGATRIFGYSAEEALGQTLDIIIPDRHRARHWAGFARTMATGETKYDTELLAVPALHKAGHRLSIEFSIVPLRDSAGTLVAIAAIIRDVTARWEQERALRAALAECQERAGLGQAAGS